VNTVRIYTALLFQLVRKKNVPDINNGLAAPKSPKGDFEEH